MFHPVITKDSLWHQKLMLCDILHVNLLAYLKVSYEYSMLVQLNCWRYVFFKSCIKCCDFPPFWFYFYGMILIIWVVPFRLFNTMASSLILTVTSYAHWHTLSSQDRARKGRLLPLIWGKTRVLLNKFSQLETAKDLCASDRERECG